MKRRLLDRLFSFLFAGNRRRLTGGPYRVPKEIDLHAFCRRIRKSPIEIAGVFNDDGRLVTAVTGNDRSVAIDTVAVPLRDACVVHNHPDGFPFSAQDIRFACRNDVEVMILVTRAGIHFLRRPSDGWPASDRLILVSPRGDRPSDGRVTERSRSGLRFTSRNFVRPDRRRGIREDRSRVRL